MPLVTIYTDGACSPNPGPGGWAALLRFIVPSTGEVIERELTGYDPSTTNNRMEIMAAIAGLEFLTKPCEVRLYSDSRLLVNGASTWILKWRRTGWRRGRRAGQQGLFGPNGKPIANIDLWQRLDRAMGRHNVILEWVRGHNGHSDNERVDRLATAALALGRRAA